MLRFMNSVTFAICISFCVVHRVYSDGPMIASATLYSATDGSLVGTVNFTQDSIGSLVNINGVITQFPDKTTEQFGFHVHQYGTLGENCTACGGHYNPTGGTHGAPWNDTRHNGDLGNLNYTDNGVFNFSDSVIQLTCQYSIIGRTLVLHAGTDDYGMNGTNSESAITGDAGARFACGIIGIVSDFNQAEQCGTGGGTTLMNNFKIFNLIALFVFAKNIFV